MGYISAQQAATKWGISKRRVQVLCTENRIKNATRIGNMWVVPEDALKPADGRVQTHHTVESPTARAARTALKKLTVNAYQEINGKLNNPSTSKMVFVSLLATTIFCDIQNDESSNEKDDVFLMISSELLEIEFKESSRRSFWEMFSSLVSYDQPYSLCWRSLTSPTNQRTMIASIIPSMPTCQSVQLLQTTPVEDLLMILALFNSKVFDFFVRLKMGGIDLTQSVVRQIPVPFREAWNSMVTLHGVDYTALDAVRALERLLYRNEPDLCGLWDGVPEIKNADNYYKTAADVREEIDKIIFQMYGLTSAEEKMVRNSFKA